MEFYKCDIGVRLYKPPAISSAAEKGIKWMKRESYIKCEMSDPKEMIDNDEVAEEIEPTRRMNHHHHPQKNWLTYFAAIW